MPKSASDDDKWSEGPPFCFLTPCVHVFAVKMGLYMNLREQERPAVAAAGESRTKCRGRNSHRQEIEGNWIFEIQKV